MLTHERLKEILRYDHETGNFYWKVALATHIKIGDKAGFLDSRYIRISIDRKRYQAHRLAWLYVYGKFPEQHIDHINGVKTDNRIENLRDVDILTNNQNMREASKSSTLGILGVSPRNGRFRARIGVNGKIINLGTYDTVEEAYQAYLEGKRTHHMGSTL